MFYYLHLLILAIGFCSVGWYLSAIQANILVWLSLVSLIVYLVNTQQGGIVLAHAWLSMLMAISAVTRIWPSVWPWYIPQYRPRIWALILLVIWVIAATLIHTLALSPQLTQKELTQRPNTLRHRTLALSPSSTSANPSTIILVVLSWVGSAIALGVITYALGVGT